MKLIEDKLLISIDIATKKGDYSCETKARVIDGILQIESIRVFKNGN